MKTKFPYIVPIFVVGVLCSTPEIIVANFTPPAHQPHGHEVEVTSQPFAPFNPQITGSYHVG